MLEQGRNRLHVYNTQSSGSAASNSLGTGKSAFMQSSGVIESVDQLGHRQVQAAQLIESLNLALLAAGGQDAHEFIVCVQQT